MTFKASELPYQAKQEMLDQIRQQIGAAEYSTLVDRFGEDDLLELALGKANELAKEAASREKEGFWDRHGWWIMIVVCILFALAGHWDLLGVLAFYLVGSWVLTIVQQIWEWWDGIINPPWLRR